MTLTLGDIFKRFQDTPLAIEVHRPETVVNVFSSVNDYGSGSLVFNDEPAKNEALLASPPAAVVTTGELAAALTTGNDNLGVIVSDDVKLAHALFRQAFDDFDYGTQEWPRIHPTAVIHESCSVPESCVVGPGAVLGARVTVGERVVIQANAVIENDVLIGDDCLIHARVFVGQKCQIGQRVRLKPGCVIGAEGFGFAQDQDKRFHRIPQTGIVVIEDDVVISANSTVDRATYGATRINRGTKIDALCHVAHNVFIDEDCALAAHTGISGSTRFGKRVLASGQTGVIDHVSVGDDVVLVHRAGVSEDILEPGVYAAGPTQPFREYTRNISVFKKLYGLLQRLRNLEKRVEALSPDSDKTET